MPSPPARETAATSLASVPLAMPPRRIGWRMPSRSVTLVRISVQLPTSASGRTGEPVAPISFRGEATKRNS